DDLRHAEGRREGHGDRGRAPAGEVRRRLGRLARRMKLMRVEAARAAMLAEVAPLAVERAPLRDAVGRVLAEAVVAARHQPPYDASAMDGWAVRAADTPGALRIVGESAAGRGYEGAV